MPIEGHSRRPVVALGAVGLVALVLVIAVVATGSGHGRDPTPKLPTLGPATDILRR